MQVFAYGSGRAVLQEEFEEEVVDEDEEGMIEDEVLTVDPMQVAVSTTCNAAIVLLVRYCSVVGSTAAV